MERYFAAGAKINLFSEGRETEVYIIEKTWEAGSCVSYQVFFHDQKGQICKGILNEYCPKFLDGIKREGQKISVPEKLMPDFETGLNRFKENRLKLNRLLEKEASGSCLYPLLPELYSGNNTLYVLYGWNNGQTYDKLSDKNVYDIVKRLLAVTLGVKQYHKAGFLHLNIRPENVLIAENTADSVKLFDFGSLTSLADIKNGAALEPVIPEGFYVPELSGGGLADADEQTDIYEIGALLFSRLFGRLPSFEDINPELSLDFSSAKLLNDEPQKLLEEIEGLLKRTLTKYKRFRYKSIDELIRQLKHILSIGESGKTQIQNLPFWQPSAFCVERKKELEDVRSILDRFGYVFIKGMGGLGKSELTKIFAKEYKDRFHTVQFCEYVDSIKDLVAAMPVEGLNNRDYGNVNQLFKVKNKILHQSDSGTLIIIDNFNVTDDKDLREFLPADKDSFKVIFNTRCMPAEDYCREKVYELPPLSMGESKSLFRMHTSYSRLSEERVLEKLIEEIQYSTLLLVLIAKIAARTDISLEELLEKLQKNQLRKLDISVFREYGFSDEEAEKYSRIASHISCVFSITSLTEAEKTALVNMTLVSNYGILKADFLNSCSSPSIKTETVNSLVNRGWLEERNGCIFMHPVISDVIAEKGIKKLDSYYLLAEYLEEACDIDEECHISEIQTALAIAKQLEKRYRGEDEIFQAYSFYYLGNIYMALFEQKNAKAFLGKAYDIFIREEYFEMIPMIFFKMGNYENIFGTKTKALELYDKAIKTADKSIFEHKILTAAVMKRIALCYEENNEKKRAVDEYKKLFNFVFKYKLQEYVDLESIAENMLLLADELELTGEKECLKELFEKNGIDTDFFESISQIKDEEENMLESFYESVDSYEDLLGEIREELGEDSPYYRDILKYRWVYYIINGRLDEAREQIQESMAYVETTYGNDSMEMAEFCSVLASYVVELIELDYASDLALRAIRNCKIHGQTDSYVYVRANIDLCRACIYRGNISKALNYVSNLDIEKYSGTEYISDMITSLGIVFIELNMYDKVIPMAKKVMQSKSADRYSKILAAVIMFVYYVNKFNVEQAESYLERIEQQVSSIQDNIYTVNYLMVYNRMAAKLYSQKGDNLTALEYINKAIELYDNIDDRNYVLLICYLERSVYNIYLEEYSKASEDLNISERMINRYKITGEKLFIYYNNRGLLYFSKKDYANAEKYYNKIFEEDPDVKSPTKILDAVVCQNYSILEMNLGNTELAEDFVNRSIAYFEMNNLSNSIECIYAKRILFIILLNEEKYDKILDVALYLYDNCEYIRNMDIYFYVNICAAIVIGLFLLGKDKKAYSFAINEDKNIARKYGKLSPERILFLQNMCGNFRCFKDASAFDFLLMAKKLIIKAKLEDSIYQASQENYLGLMYFEMDDPVMARICFEDAIELMDKLPEKEDSLYKLVKENLQKAKEAETDNLDYSDLFS